ncbi:MAG: patatin-like phospholipase family protein [Muribaculaceae bacterium]|nr:patatin-like phospholipase family protein [Muribaculaceae bacterium]
MDQKKYRIGLALSGGGVRCFAHIGALRAFEDVGIKPDIIAGVSAGSVVAAFYAAGMTANEIFKLFGGINIYKFFQIDISKSGLLKLDKLRKFIAKHIPVDNIEQLNIPTIIAATDFEQQQEMAFTSGNIAERVVASCCIPLVFKPVKINGNYYVDGGVLHNMPSYYLRPLCNTLIGINVNPTKLGPIKMNVRALAYRTFKLLTMHNEIADKQLCDILIDITSIQQHSSIDTRLAIRIAQKGYFETMKILKNSQQIKRLINE